MLKLAADAAREAEMPPEMLSKRAPCTAMGGQALDKCAGVNPGMIAWAGQIGEVFQAGWEKKDR